MIRFPVDCMCTRAENGEHSRSFQIIDPVRERERKVYIQKGRGVCVDHFIYLCLHDRIRLMDAQFPMLVGLGVTQSFSQYELS